MVTCNIHQVLQKAPVEGGLYPAPAVEMFVPARVHPFIGRHCQEHNLNHSCCSKIGIHVFPSFSRR